VFCLEIGTFLFAPLIGRLVDRVGVRPVALFSQLGLAIGFLLLACVNAQIWTFYAAWFAASVFGAGTSPIVWTRAVAGWFNRHRGLALGIMLSGTGAIAVISPIVVNAIIASFGWRGAYIALAATLVVIGMPATYALLRTPEQTDPAHARPVVGASLGEAYRSMYFWRIIVAFVLFSTVAGGTIVHLPPMLVDQGYAPRDAAFVVSFLGYAIIAGRLGLGFLLDLLPPALIGGLFLLLAAVSCTILASHGSAIFAVILFGLFSGAEVDLLAYLISRIFGLKHYAQLYAWGISAFTFGAGVGPIIAGTIHDHTGSYQSALYAFAAVIVVASGLVFSLAPALRSAASQETPQAS
jgi:MFS family permease